MKIDTPTLAKYLIEIITHYNKLFLKKCGGDKNLLKLLLEKSDEPGLTEQEILSFDSSLLEPYEDFSDRFAEFFAMHGIELVYYDDSGDIFLFVTESNKYKIFLSDLEKIPDQNIKIAFVKKIEMGLEERIRQIIISLNHLTGSEEMEFLLENRYGYFLRTIPVLLDIHKIICISFSKKDLEIRKRISLKIEAYVGGYLPPLMFLLSYLDREDVGTFSMLENLYDVNQKKENDIYDWWYFATNHLRIAVNIYGKKARPIIDKVMANLIVAMEKLKVKIEKSKSQLSASNLRTLNSIVNYFTGILEELSSIELEYKKSKPFKKPEIKILTPKQKMDGVIKHIKSHYFNEKELESLTKKVGRIKPVKKIDLPF